MGQEGGELQGNAGLFLSVSVGVCVWGGGMSVLIKILKSNVMLENSEL